MLPAHPEPVHHDRSSAPHSTLDPEPLAAWRALTEQSASTFVCELIDDFLSDTTTQLAILEHAAAAGDTAACTFIAHRLQSSCSLLGAFRLATLLEEMELLAKNGAVPFLRSQVVKIKAEYGRLELALEQERAVG